MSDERQNIDREVKLCGAEKTLRVDLGLELLARRAIYGVPLTQDDIAAWCGCSRDAIYFAEKMALKKLATKLQFGREKTTGRELR
jgi:hypothetical protein